MSRKHDIELPESEKSTAFQTFCNKATTEFGKTQHKMSLFTRSMIAYMKKNIDYIRFVGQGSSRIVFAMADGTALKLAKTRAGIAQNKQEAKICMDKKMQYQIFPDFYDVDQKQWLALNCELCAPADKLDFRELFKAQPMVISELVKFIFTTMPSSLTLDQMLKKAKDFYTNDAPNAVKQVLLERLESTQTPAIVALKSLFDFYHQHGIDELIPDDLDSIENWGITVRDGQKTLVIIDAGFSEDVWQKYYKKMKIDHEN